ncbi:MAG: hypothetical protein A3F83_06100 [Candidatus Glassbacteria bacterium RIFCSPLOWO2_12_FULL_58_11]|uniref:Uncharacterized protein n=1 Tax=Candidatus Glassbacteria bacterium RIFCSPLOWO2_12_FULL_58_11 TaxID=1817867 RepID=A0A1F5YM73_9BACT|nr:MAG: hypothetical protein A3F83_06100 [Candidatus Glassbacteria bacterium RIFCSPLOWO2_12_FULL_58_11]
MLPENPPDALEFDLILFTARSYIIFILQAWVILCLSAVFLFIDQVFVSSGGKHLVKFKIKPAYFLRRGPQCLEILGQERRIERSEIGGLRARTHAELTATARIRTRYCPAAAVQPGAA